MQACDESRVARRLLTAAELSVVCKNEPLFAPPSDAQQKSVTLAIYPGELRSMRRNG